MTELPAGVRRRLGDALLPSLLTEVRQLSTDAGATRKSLWRLYDGTLIESVLMRYPDRITVCVSSQAGCGMACPFCATGQGGLRRNLSAGEIVEQVAAAARSVARGRAARRRWPAVERGVHGDGRTARELSSLGSSLASHRRSAAGRAGHVATISYRVDGRAGAGDGPIGRGRPCGHARGVAACAGRRLRDSLVPINTRWRVAEVLAAADAYAARTGRRYSIEYAMIRGVNDQDWRADLLGDLLAGRLAHVNLIPLNPTPGSAWDASPKPVEREFVRRLSARGVAVTVRDTRGREIDGACGQLAATASS